MIKHDEDKRAAIVCRHVAKDGFPILRALRTESLEPEDSGWQFLCNSGYEENEAEAQVWLVNEVIKSEPSLSQFIDSPVGTVLCRTNQDSKWEAVDNAAKQSGRCEPPSGGRSRQSCS